MTLVGEVASAYLKALQTDGAACLIAVLFGVGVAWAVRFGLARFGRRGQLRWQRQVLLVSLCVALGLGLRSVFDRAACFDDAYISLRYADNLARGHGLVFNLGEQVEGYTNFLWTVILAAGIWLFKGGGPVIAVSLCVVAYVANILVISRLGWKLFPMKGRLYLPIAACLLALHPLMVSYGTSGLETQFASLLINVGLLLWMGARTRVELARAAFFFILAALARPDHGLFFALGGVVLLIEALSRVRANWRVRRGASLRESLLDLAAYSAPFGIYAVYLGWKLSFYGSLVPNTYYAKSADLTYWSQGWAYVTEFALSSHLWAALPFVVWLSVSRRGSPEARRFFAFSGPAIVLYAVYVAKVGGDFMHGRFFLTLVPLIILSLEQVFYRALLVQEAKRSTWRAPLVLTLAAAVLSLSAAPLDLIGQRKMKWGIAHEPDYYQITSWKPLTVDHFNYKVGKLFEALGDAGHPPRVAMKTVGMPAYYGKNFTLDRRGLTDAHVAHLPLKRRGRPGHEKMADRAYVASRHVHFMDDEDCPPWFNNATRLQFSGVSRIFSIQRYDAPLMDALKRVDPGVRFTPAPRAIDQYISTMRIRTPARVASHLKWLRGYYFDHNKDPHRLAVIEKYAAGDLTAAPGYLSPQQDPSAGSGTEVTIAFGGDSILARSVNTIVSRSGVARPLSDVRQLVSVADYAVVNLECVLASGGTHSSLDRYAKPYLRGRPELVGILTHAGFDLASMANNHGGDYGPEAVRESRRILTQAGIDPLGVGMNLSEARRPVVRKVGAFSVAFIGVQTMVPDSAAGSRRGGTNYLSLGHLDSAVEVLATQVDEARRSADFVFLMIHWGPNNRERPDATHREFARRAVQEAGIDGLLGTSAHLLQGIEVIDGRPIIYDAGNLILDWAATHPWTHKSGLFTLHVGEHGVSRVVMDPLLLHHGRTVRAPARVATATLARVKTLSKELGTNLSIEGEQAVLTLTRGPSPRPLSTHRQEAVRRRTVLPQAPTEVPGAIVKKVPAAARKLAVKFEDDLELVGVELPEEASLKLGINIGTYWTSSAPQTEVHEIFFEIVPQTDGKEGEPWRKQEEHQPADWMYPTSWWEVDEIVRDFFHIRTSGKLKKPTPHEVYVGIKVGGRRLKPLEGAGKVRNDAVLLDTLILR